MTTDQLLATTTPGGQPWRKMAEGRVSRERHFELLNLKRGSYPTPDGAYLGEWWEIDAEEYHDFMDILPPLYFSLSGFAMSEITSGDVTGGYVRVCPDDGPPRYFHAWVAASSPREWLAAARAHIRGEIEQGRA